MILKHIIIIDNKIHSVFSNQSLFRIEPELIINALQASYSQNRLQLSMAL